MKKAWEDVEPGRAERARQSRLRFLNSNLVSLAPATDDEAGGGAASGEEGASTAPVPEEAAPAQPDALAIQLDANLDDETLTLDPPTAEVVGTPNEMLPPPDLTPFLVGDPMAAIFKDYATRVQEETEAKRKGIEEHRLFMTDWEDRVQEDKRLRNRKKTQQIEDAYKIQVTKMIINPYVVKCNICTVLSKLPLQFYLFQAEINAYRCRYTLTTFHYFTKASKEDETASSTSSRVSSSRLPPPLCENSLLRMTEVEAGRFAATSAAPEVLPPL